jgi:hypothetical protein
MSNRKPKLTLSGVSQESIDTMYETKAMTGIPLCKQQDLMVKYFDRHPDAIPELWEAWTNRLSGRGATSKKRASWGARFRSWFIRS